MTDRIATPASCQRRPTVAVLGAGIAGLTAAHELAERGFEVTVYEPRPDERSGLDDQPAGSYPPVKFGGLAASQYSTVGPGGGDTAELRPFPGRRGSPCDPPRPVAGEHGFRFFPAYYRHIWDLFQRIPVYQRTDRPDGQVVWQMTSRTVMDNVRRVITQGTTVEGKPSLVFPRERPRTLAELVTTANQLRELGFSPSDVQTFVGRLIQYLSTSPLRRASELQNLSAYDYFIGRDASVPRRYYYTPGFDALLLEMPRVLAAFDSHWGDARTNLTTYLQLQLQMDRDDDKADGVLNGPTTEAWFDHWYRHLIELGVRVVRSGADRIDAPLVDRAVPPHLRPRVQVQLTNGARLAADYVVVAVDAPAAERITAPLRAAGTGGTVAGLDGFTTSVPPVGGPLHPETSRSSARRDPYVLDEMGRVPWDRFQTLAGVQYFFDTEFQLLRGHMYYSGTEWGLSSINQSGMWERPRTLAHDGHISVLSVDIGDFNTPSKHLLDTSGRGKAARDCTPDELAQEVWRQIAHAVTSDAGSAPESLLPWPAWYALDRNLRFTGTPSTGRLVRNEAPYLVPIVGDWPNRPGCDPWNPHGTSWTTRSTEASWLENLEQLNVWQARHGGCQVHHNSVVFAGTWNKTFTRMTSMEAACESGRHAVNAILDHYIWVESGGADRREKTTLNWRFPFGFIDQGFSSPIRLPTPAGDYCYVFDVENQEPAETRTLRNLDTQYCLASLPHPLDPSAAYSAGRPASPVPAIPGGQPVTSPSPSAGYAQQLLGYLQAWRQYLEQTAGVTTPSQAPPSAPWGMPPMPAAGLCGPPPMPTATQSPAAGPPMDYTQQLLAYLQVWRQYLEQAMNVAGPGRYTTPMAGTAMTPPPCPPTSTTPPTPPDPPASQDGSPRQTAGDPTSPRTMLVPPRNWNSSQFAFPHHHQGESTPGTESLYNSSRLVFTASPAVESQPASAYATPTETAAVAPPPVPQSLYQAAGAPTAPARETVQRPEELEIIRPVQDSSR